MKPDHPVIKTHAELAEQIAGHSVMHMNSLGKDSVLTLEWLTRFAKVSRIVSVTFEHLVPHPGDKAYKQYLKNRYPDVEFRSEPSPVAITNYMRGKFQPPDEVLRFCNASEYDTFNHQKAAEDIRVELGLDFICYGVARYESFDRARYFHRRGIFTPPQIFPLGMMSKQQTYALIQSCGFKIHPSYKLAKSSLDRPAYYKMRSAFIVDPEYKRKMYNAYPLLALDEYRWERLLRGPK